MYGIFFYHVLRSPATSVAYENAAILFRCEAPEKFLSFKLHPTLHLQGGEMIAAKMSFMG